MYATEILKDVENGLNERTKSMLPMRMFDYCQRAPGLTVWLLVSLYTYATNDNGHDQVHMADICV